MGILGRLASDDYLAPTKLTVADYVRDAWLPHLEDQVTAGALRATTVAQYRTLVGTHIVPHLGGVPLRKLDPVRLDRLYAELRRSGRRVAEGKPPAG